MRGVLQSGRIEASHILSPIITLPTQIGGRFETHFLSRPVKPRGLIYGRKRFTAGPMVVGADSYSLLFGDKDKIIVPNADRLGDNTDRTNNQYFTRFRASAPLVTARFAFRQGANSWGKLIKSFGLVISVRLGSRRIIAKSQKIGAVNALANNTTINVSGTTSFVATGFQGPVTCNYQRIHKARPGYSASSAGYTQSYVLEIAFRPIIPTNLNLTNQALYIEFALHTTTIGLTTDQVGLATVDNATVTMDSLL